MKKLALIVALILFSLGVGKGLYFLKDGFSFRRVSALKKQSYAGWDEETEEALKQTFHYIGRGRQCFAFASEDDQYVLKFPRTDIYSTPFWARVLPFREYREVLESAHSKREERMRRSFDLCMNELKDETGLIAIHLGQTEKDDRTLTVIDATGSKHILPLYKSSFIFQYKKPILMRLFQSAIEKENRSEAEKILDALIDVVVARAKKGILNRDRSFLRNYGYDGKKAYQIDVGSFFKSKQLEPEAAYQKSVRDSMDAVQEWLRDHDPELEGYLNQKLATIL